LDGPFIACSFFNCIKDKFSTTSKKYKEAKQKITSNRYKFTDFFVKNLVVPQKGAKLRPVLP